MRFADKKKEAEYKVLFDLEGARQQNQDYLGALEYNTEFYKAHGPKVQYLELDQKASRPRGELGDFYNEQLANLHFDRDLRIPAFPEFHNPRSPHHTRVGLEYQHDLRLALGVLILKEFDVFPQEGDHLIYANFRYTIVRVEVRPEDYWTHTNLPVNVSAYANLYRPGTTGKYDIRNPQKDPKEGEGKKVTLDERYDGFA